jgi:hypothetical protein
MSEERRQDYSALLAVLDEQFKTLRESNEQDHKEIKERLQSHNNYQGRLSMMEEFCSELKESNIRKRLAKMEVYVGIGAIITGTMFTALISILVHYLKLLVAK